MEHLYSHELLEQFKAGKRNFDNVFLRFVDLSNLDLSGICFTNSKLEYTKFWFSKMKNTKFVNCEIYFCGFLSADVENLVFEKCAIDMTRFDNALMKNTRAAGCSFSYCLALNTNLGEFDTQGSTLFKVLTDSKDVTSLTDEEISDALKIVGNRMEDLPIEIKVEIQKRITGILEKFNRDPRLSQMQGQEKPYIGAASKAEILYGALNSFADEVMKYGSTGEYASGKKKKDIYK